MRTWTFVGLLDTTFTLMGMMLTFFATTSFKSPRLVRSSLEEVVF